MAGRRVVFLIATIVLVLLGVLAFEVISTQPVRGAVRTCSELFTIANRTDLTDSERLSAARRSARRGIFSTTLWPSPPRVESSTFRATSTYTSRHGAKDPTSGSDRPTGLARSTSSFLNRDAGASTGWSRTWGLTAKSCGLQNFPSRCQSD